MVTLPDAVGPVRQTAYVTYPAFRGQAFSDALAAGNARQRFADASARRRRYRIRASPGPTSHPCDPAVALRTVTLPPLPPHREPVVPHSFSGAGTVPRCPSNGRAKVSHTGDEPGGLVPYVLVGNVSHVGRRCAGRAVTSWSLPPGPAASSRRAAQPEPAERAQGGSGRCADDGAGGHPMRADGPVWRRRVVREAIDRRRVDQVRRRRPLLPQGTRDRANLVIVE